MFRQSFIALLLLALLVIASCGRPGSNADVPTSTPHSTADLDDFVDYLRGLLITHPQNPSPVYEMYHFTEEWQREEIEWMHQHRSARYELQLACIEQYGRVPELYDQSPWPAEDVRIVERSTHAARLRLTGPNHNDHTWHLTLINGDWRIDASRMIERTPTELLEAKATVIADSQRMSQKYRTMSERIRRGELTWEQVSSY